MILVDSNIFMYAAGALHPNKRPSVAWLERVARGEVDVVIDTEVLQEILHRYRAIRRWDEGRAVYDNVRRLVPLAIPISVEIMDRARALLDRYDHLMARDALHAAVVQEHKLKAVCSFDTDFDAVKGVKRIEPSAG
ncbi:MAG: type II toxin-antitoxin system VapC family toxin [bacterium]|nr:type II toxin-antitoxin system VapC family toxin [bacterium]